jgi:ATP-dependent Clp protease ATP-binding subunit ClpA
VLELALRESLRLRHPSISPEHILLGLLREGEGLAALILTREGLDVAELRRRTINALGAVA